MKKRFLICFVCLVCLLTISAFAAAPTIISQPQTYYFSPTTEFPAYAYFSVLASGDTLSYQWQVSTDSGSNWSNSTSNYARTPNLRARIGSLDQVGTVQYRCVVSSSDGDTVTDTVSIAAPIAQYQLSDMLSWVGSVADNVFSWASDACTTIVQQPLLLFTVGFFALGGAIGIVSRLLSRS